MEFALTEEQQMIRDTAESFLADKSSSEAIRSAMATELGYDETLWSSVCDEMYWHAIHIPEEYGGLGLGYVEVAVVMEQMGKRLLCSPYFSTVAMGINALLLAGNDSQKTEWLAKIIEGQSATLGFTAGGRDWGASSVTASYTKNASGEFCINGEYQFVVDGHSANILIVAARDADSGELSLFVLPADTAGVERVWTPSMDQTRKLAKVVLSSVTVPADACLDGAINSGRSGTETLTDVLDLAMIALAAEQSGGAQAILEQAVAYTLEREQFGRSIASFQGIKHKAADMKLKAEVSRSAVYYAACVAQELLAGAEGDQQVASELAEAASMAAAYCSDTYYFNAGSGLQMYGGVGFTWEYDVHLYFKRAKSSETLLGDGAWHRERIAAQLLGANSAEGAGQ